MKNYFKKFSIMFVLLLAVIGFGTIQNGTIANAATVGQQLAAPETGWKRYDDTDSKIQYKGNWLIENWGFLFNGNEHYSNDASASSTFKFYGTKFRLMGEVGGDWYWAKSVNVSIDNNVDNYFNSSLLGSAYSGQILLYDSNTMQLGTHIVTITNPNSTRISLDAIDIDNGGYLIDLSANLSTTITLNKSTDNLQVGQTDTLTATTTPSVVPVTWSSSDSTIATVDNSGNVTAIKDGQAIITATTTDGSNLSSSCTLNVTKKAEQESISLNKSVMDLETTNSETLIATTTPSAVNVTWSSSDTSVATVDSSGKVIAIGAGTATITAITADGSNLSSSCNVIVTNKTDPEPTESEYIVNTAYAKGDNTNNASGGVSIIFKGVAEAQLSVVKTADVESVYVGDSFTYTLVVTNTSTKTAKAVVIKDSAPNHIQFTVNGVTTTQGKVDSSSTASNIVVNVGDIPPLGTVTIKIPATVIL